MKQDLAPIRRQFMQSMVALPWVAALTSLHSRAAWAESSNAVIASPYSGFGPVNDLTTGLPLLQLPTGFTYKSFAWTGDVMANGKPMPSNHDGMAVVPDPARPKNLWVIRHHERSTGSDGTWFGAKQVYDRGTTGGGFAAGGTTSSLFRSGGDGTWVKSNPSLGGTMVNCAGGGTPWGTWLTCEEVGSDTASSTGKKHGYMFEVQFLQKPSNAVPIVAAGRFKREAAAVDPANSMVYMTEDDSGKAGLYRYVPTVTTGAIGTLAQGGQLQMAKVVGSNNVNIANPTVGQTYSIQWVNIANPDQNRGTARAVNGSTISSCSGPFCQGYAQGALRMYRGEGIAYHDGKIFIMDTSAGSAGRGAIWAYDIATSVLTCFYVSTSVATGDHGDNIIVSPRGGLLMCEDPDSAPNDQFGSGTRMMGFTPAGDVFIFGKYNYNVSSSQLSAAGKMTSLSGNRKGGEFAGACWDASGKWLFVNNQDPGITFAITGPWTDGPL